MRAESALVRLVSSGRQPFLITGAEGGCEWAPWAFYRLFMMCAAAVTAHD